VVGDHARLLKLLLLLLETAGSTQQARESGGHGRPLGTMSGIRDLAELIIQIGSLPKQLGTSLLFGDHVYQTVRNHAYNTAGVLAPGHPFSQFWRATREY
jgi:hypothetical protein